MKLILYMNDNSDELYKMKNSDQYYGGPNMSPQKPKTWTVDWTKIQTQKVVPTKISRVYATFFIFLDNLQNILQHVRGKRNMNRFTFNKSLLFVLISRA